MGADPWGQAAWQPAKGAGWPPMGPQYNGAMAPFHGQGPAWLSAPPGGAALPPPPSLATRAAPGAAMCNDFGRGMCQRGSMCIFRHA